jgi:hypothetical protein
VRFAKHKTTVPGVDCVGAAIVTRLRRTCLPIDFDVPEFDSVAGLEAVQTQMRAGYLAEVACEGVEDSVRSV